MKRILPVRVPSFEFRRVAVVRTKNINPYKLKFAIRSVAREFNEYFLPIETDIPVSGRTDTGEKIPINTLGKWLFGVPGYMGHYRQEVEGDLVSIWIPNVDEARKLIEKSLKKLSEEGIVIQEI